MQVCGCVIARLRVVQPHCPSCCMFSCPCLIQNRVGPVHNVLPSSVLRIEWGRAPGLTPRARAMRTGNILSLYPSERRLASMTTMFSVVAWRVVLLKCTSEILSGLVLLVSVISVYACVFLFCGPQRVYACGRACVYACLRVRMGACMQVYMVTRLNHKSSAPFLPVMVINGCERLVV